VLIFKHCSDVVSIDLFSRARFMKAVFVAALLALAAPPVFADPQDCAGQGCRSLFQFASTSDERSYGLLIAAPDSGCRRVRFRVEGAGKAFLGHTPPLGPGELAVVRMGRGFSPGDHSLVIAAEGCATFPAATRRVSFAKPSPDHGWRAGD
jgi:hypothetical protein